MKCNECDKFCRFPRNPQKGICSEAVNEIVNYYEINGKIEWIKDENQKCCFIWCKLM